MSWLSTPLGRYRIMAYIVGTMLIFVFLFGHVGHASIVGYKLSVRVEDVIGPIHGALYIVYLLTVLLLWRQYRLPVQVLVIMIAAGWLPFTAFIGERWVMRRLRAEAPGDGTLYSSGSPLRRGAGSQQQQP